MANWLNPLIETFVSLLRTRITTYDQTAATQLLFELAAADRNKKVDETLGFEYIATTYSEQGRTMFFNSVIRLWNKAPETDEAQIINTQATQSLRCVLSVQCANAENLLSIVEGRLTLTTSDFTILQIKHVHDNWWDVLLAYKNNLAEMYSKLLSAEEVTALVTKPITEFGKRTLATLYV